MNLFNRLLPSALLLLLASGGAIRAQELRLRLDPALGHAGETSIPYATGAADTPARLLGSATLVEAGGQKAIALGSQGGYVDLGEAAGEISATLSDFTLHMKAYLPKWADLSAAGNFLCSFSHTQDANNEATGYFFLSAKDTRYAISRTNWRGETSTDNLGTLPEGMRAVPGLGSDGGAHVAPLGYRGNANGKSGYLAVYPGTGNIFIWTTTAGADQQYYFGQVVVPLAS